MEYDIKHTHTQDFKLILVPRTLIQAWENQQKYANESNEIQRNHLFLQRQHLL